MGVNSPFNKLLHGSATLNPASLDDGEGANLAITVTGAVVGDYVSVAPGVDLQGILMSASVIDDDSVEVRIQNETGGTIDLASSVWRAVVYKI